MINKMELEEVKLLTISKKDGVFRVRLEEEYFNDYELFGFLKIYLKAMEERFIDELREPEDED